MPQTRNRKARNRRRSTTPLPETLSNQLRDYADAAKGAPRADPTWLLSGVTVGAVGLGLFSLPPVANAEVVFTPANQSVNRFSRRKLQIDFNNDGIADASLSDYGYCNSGSGNRDCFGSIFADGLQGNQVMVTSGGFASAAKVGKIIGRQDKFGRFPKMADGRSDYNGISHTSFRSSKGPWVNVKSRYLGFKFKINGEAHYGWARITTSGFPGNPSARLTGYAYETIADQPIVAGDVSGSAAVQMAPQDNFDAGAGPHRSYSSLGMLAAGNPALEIWRKPSEDDLR